MTELLKQGRFKPLAVDGQVAVLFAGNKGFLDDWTRGRRSLPRRSDGVLEGAYRKLLAEIRAAKIDDRFGMELEQAITDYKDQFLASTRLREGARQVGRRRMEGNKPDGQPPRNKKANRFGIYYRADHAHYGNGRHGEDQRVPCSAPRTRAVLRARLPTSCSPLRAILRSDVNSPLLVNPETYERALVMAISSDRGLAGGFNVQVDRAARAAHRALPPARRQAHRTHYLRP